MLFDQLTQRFRRFAINDATTGINQWAFCFGKHVEKFSRFVIIKVVAFNGFDTLTITTNDQGNTGTGGALQDVDNISITVGNPNAPALNLDANDSSGAGGNDFSTSFDEGGAAVLVADTDATLVDSDENLTGMTVTITNLLDGAAESLAANTSGTSIVANYNSGTGVLTLSGADTAANYQHK